MKRQKTQYPGVFWKEVRRIGGKRGEKEKSFFIVFKQDGKTVEEHAGYQHRDNMTAAKAAQIRGQRIENRRKSRKQIRQEQGAASWTFQKLWDHYVEYRKRENKGKGPSHADVSRFQTYIKDTIGAKRPSELMPVGLDPIHELLQERAPGTRYAVLQMINRLSTYGKKNMLCDPIRFHIKLPKVDAERTESLSDEQFETLLNVLDADNGTVAKMMKMALFTGMRKMEIVNLQWGNVDLGARIITVKGKTQKTHRIPINDAALSILLSMDQSTEFVFPEAQEKGSNWLMGEANYLKGAAVLPRDFRPFHGLRHAFASRLASSGVPLYAVSKLLTHTNLQMTSRYAHLSEKALMDASNVMSEVTNGKD